MIVALEIVVGGEQGKNWIRDRFPANSNYPMVCRNPNCYAPLGIFHSDPISEAAFFEDGVSRRGDSTSVTCPNCETKHDYTRYVNEHFDGTDELPTEARITLEEMPRLLRAGVTRFPRPQKQA